MYRVYSLQFWQTGKVNTKHRYVLRVILSMYIQNLCNFQRFPPVAWSIYTHVQVYHRAEETDESHRTMGGLSVVNSKQSPSRGAMRRRFMEISGVLSLATPYKIILCERWKVSRRYIYFLASRRSSGFIEKSRKLAK